MFWHIHIESVISCPVFDLCLTSDVTWGQQPPAPLLSNELKKMHKRIVRFKKPPIYVFNPTLKKMKSNK